MAKKILKIGDIAKDYNGNRWRIEVESNLVQKVLKYDVSGALQSYFEDEDEDVEGWRFAGCIGVDKDNFGEIVAWAYSPSKPIILGQ